MASYNKIDYLCTQNGLYHAKNQTISRITITHRRYMDGMPNTYTRDAAG